MEQNFEIRNNQIQQTAEIQHDGVKITLSVRGIPKDASADDHNYLTKAHVRQDCAIFPQKLRTLMQ